MHICPEFQLTPLCSPVLAQPSTCRTLQSVQDPLPGSPQLLLAQTPNLCQKLLQIVHHLFLCQTRVPQTIRASQAASHSQEAVGEVDPRSSVDTAELCVPVVTCVLLS